MRQVDIVAETSLQSASLQVGVVVSIPRRQLQLAQGVVLPLPDEEVLVDPSVMIRVLLPGGRVLPCPLLLERECAQVPIDHCVQHMPSASRDARQRLVGHEEVLLHGGRRRYLPPGPRRQVFRIVRRPFGLEEHDRDAGRIPGQTFVPPGLPHELVVLRPVHQADLFVAVSVNRSVEGRAANPAHPRSRGQEIIRFLQGLVCRRFTLTFR
mmetsp:Transcript_8870/g.19191  ORF Transcript_8870/g.19191 Transcript_8870/m.19191 type:complete len:210 (+) Transcript_8870:2060-2689(+)